jgi:hypothetical protein
MRTILEFLPNPDPKASRTYQVYDETTTIDGLPDQRFGPSLLLSTGGRVEVWLSLDPAGRVQGGQGTMSLLGDSLFTPMSDAERLAWAEVCNARPLHPHEMAAFKQRGLTGRLPEVIEHPDLAAPMLAATKIRARVAMVGGGATLRAIRGRIGIRYLIDGLTAAQTMERLVA